ncbi:hypothetical protein H6785_03210 [Candidatus Nomurabacteria bacterium]|nr:hypothetical protein [Candidatus Nomurabacteria bacterium]
MQFFILCSLLVFSQLIFSAEDDSPWYVEDQIGFYQSRNSSVDSLFTNEVTIQYTNNSDNGVYFSSYYDKDFWNYLVGGTTILNGFELGLGLGQSDYSDKRWLTINPWLYYEGEETTIDIYIEYIPEEHGGDKLFYRTSLNYRVSEVAYTGIYSERWIGTGPLFGFALSEHIEVETIIFAYDRGFSSLLFRMRAIY